MHSYFIRIFCLIFFLSFFSYLSCKMREILYFTCFKFGYFYKTIEFIYFSYWNKVCIFSAICNHWKAQVLGIFNWKQRLFQYFNYFFAGLTQATCPKPEVVPGAMIESNKDQEKTSFPHNATLVYICKSGQRIKDGPADRKCVNGTWTAVKFKCERKSYTIKRKTVLQ